MHLTSSRRFSVRTEHAGGSRALSVAETRGPEVLERPLRRPFGGHDLVVLVGLRAGRGVQLVERIDRESVRPQYPDPVAVTRMELDATARPSHPTQRALRSLELRCCVSVGFGHAERYEHAVGEEHESPSGAEQPRRFAHPELRIAPQAGAVLADDEIE